MKVGQCLANYYRLATVSEDIRPKSEVFGEPLIGGKPMGNFTANNDSGCRDSVSDEKVTKCEVMQLANVVYR